MNNRSDHNTIAGDEEQVTRWIPVAVVSFALIGFFALAWYAYHSGTQSIHDGELMVIEADTSPIKEKPVDPGGMKFPNQDKTIFDTFAGNPQVPAKVERVLPAPEEPMARDLDTSETQTWINEKLKDAPQTEQVIGEAKPKAADKKAEPVVVEEKPAAGTAAKLETPQQEVVTHVAKPVAKPEPKAQTQKVEKAASSGTAKIQLGAYASEAEARGAWDKIRKKYPELASKPVYVVKADLGDKGIFYRLRAGGVGDINGAKSFCSKLSAKGQACMPVP